MQSSSYLRSTKAYIEGAGLHSAFLPYLACSITFSTWYLHGPDQSTRRLYHDPCPLLSGKNHPHPAKTLFFFDSARRMLKKYGVQSRIARVVWVSESSKVSCVQPTLFCLWGTF